MSAGDVGERIGAAVGAVVGRHLGGPLGRVLLSELPSADEAEERLPDSTDELEELSYRELQSVAKEVGVTANLTREEMTSRLVDALELDAGNGSEE